MSSSDDRDRTQREWIQSGPNQAPAELRRRVMDVDRWPRQRRPLLGGWTAPRATRWVPALLVAVLLLLIVAASPLRDLLSRVGDLPRPRVVTAEQVLRADLRQTGSVAAISAFGDVWAVTEGGSLLRISRSDAVVQVIGMSGRPCGPLVKGHDALWVPLCPVTGPTSLTGATWTRITPDGRSTRAAVPETRSQGPQIAFDEAGVWIVSDQVSGHLVYLSADGTTLLDEIRLGVETHNLLLAAGSLWVSGGRESVLRVDPSSGEVVATIGTPAGAEHLAFADGAVWVVNRRAASLTRIDPGSLATTHVPVEIGPMQLIADDRWLWVLTDETVDLIDTDRNVVVSRITVGEHQQALCCLEPTGLSTYSIARVGDDLWFAAPAHLYRLDVNAITP